MPRPRFRLRTLLNIVVGTALGFGVTAYVRRWHEADPGADFRLLPLVAITAMILLVGALAVLIVIRARDEPDPPPPR